MTPTLSNSCRGEPIKVSQFCKKQWELNELRNVVDDNSFLWFGVLFTVNWICGGGGDLGGIFKLIIK